MLSINKSKKECLINTSLLYVNFSHLPLTQHGICLNLLAMLRFKHKPEFFTNQGQIYCKAVKKESKRYISLVGVTN